VTTPSAFDADTAVTPAPTGAPGELYDATLSSTWAIGERPHGGYLLAVVARAAAEGLGVARGEAGLRGPNAEAGLRGPNAETGVHPHPLSTSAVFLRSPSFGPARIVVEVLRTGRSVSHVQTTLLQDGAASLRALHLFGPLAAGAEPHFLGETPPALPPWDECAARPSPPPMPDGSVIRVGIAEIVEMRIDPASLTEGGPGADPGELRGWLAFRDARPADPLSLLFAVDALPPVTFTLGVPGWVPTLELTAYVRGLPAPGPLQVRQRGRLLQDGRLDEVCDVWDSAGHLVAQATQLAGVRLPR
jgi:hypothetical protein